MNQRGHEVSNAGIRVVGAAWQNLRDDPGVRMMVRKQGGHGQLLVGFHEPVGDKNGLEFRRDRTDHLRDQFFIGDVPARNGIGDVLRANIADTAVDDGNLPVIAQIGAC